MKRPVLIALLIALPAFAQAQQVDPDFLKHAIEAVVAQRNQAMDQLAAAQAALAQAKAELAAAQAKIKAQEKPAEPAK